MEDETKEELNRLLDLLETHDYNVSSCELREYLRGDPTTNPTSTGAEINLTVFISHDSDIDDDENPYRVK